MSPVELRDLWRAEFRSAPPKLRKDLLVRVLAYRLQEQAFGGLSVETRARLRALAQKLNESPNPGFSKSTSIKPGTRLLREWKGQTYLVHVEQGGYEYRNTRYKSLSKIARLITGTQWSGPLFLGLKKQSKFKERANEYQL